MLVLNNCLVIANCLVYKSNPLYTNPIETLLKISASNEQMLSFTEQISANGRSESFDSKLNY